jgi:phosphoribosylaminoimidazolecarboxamide formyltransferase/IMP cyclohydrolase
MIADYLGNLQTSADEPFGETLHLPLTREANLRYGENPAQKAALYGNLSELLEQLHGKELSYNNIVDIDAALRLMSDFQQEERAVVAILKHNTPCGVGAGANPREAYEKAFATDPESPFGGILICNQTWDLQLAETVDEIFTEVLIAPDFTEEALSLLQKKKNRRLMRWNVAATPTDEADIRRVFGGWLVQERDQSVEDVHTSNVATRKAPSATELQAMDFGWRVVKHIKSNAIVFCTADRTLGVGGGQTSRVDAVRIAIESAQRQGLSLAGSTIASDAFFPFPDGVALALDAGATSVVQPGGSVRDDAAIELADQRDVSMVLTGARHFRH